MKQAVVRGALSVFLGAAFPAMAAAADLPVKAPMRATMVSVSDWTGAYVGIVGGYAWGRGHFVGTGTGAGSVNNVSMPGGMIGGRIGYDFNVNPNLVLGGVADFSWADLSGQTCVAKYACDPSQDAFALGKMKWFSTVRAKGGVAYGNSLFYVTGGPALARLEGGITNLTAAGDPTLTDSKTHLGWTVGAGVDYKVTSNVVFGVEYLYADLGREHYDFSNSLPGAPIVLGADGKLTANIVRASVSYRFGCPRC
jgi:outer membrane immunogenic protein